MARLMVIKAYTLRSRHSCINIFSLHFSAGKYRPVVRPTKRPRPGPPRPTSRPGPGPRPLPPSMSHWYLCFKLYSPSVDIFVAFCHSSPSTPSSFLPLQPLDADLLFMKSQFYLGDRSANLSKQASKLIGMVYAKFSPVI